jgi:Flp pilus assembly protein TadD
MFRSAFHLAHFSKAYIFLSAAFLLLSSAVAARAQFGKTDTDPGQGLGGRSVIDGRIYYPSGRPLDKRVRVRLSGIRGGEQTAISDDNGAFVFRRLPTGKYTLTIDAGKEYEPVSESVEIREILGSQVTTLTIQLKLKSSSSSKPATVDAMMAGVPKPAVKLYQQGLAAAQKGDRRKAIEHLKNAVTLHPGFVPALNELGVQYLRLGQFDDAAEAFLSAIKIAPDEFSPRLNYGILLVQKRDFAAAEAELRRAVERNDASSIAHLYRGRALIGLDRTDEAEKELRRAIDLGGEAVALAHRYLGALYNQRGDDARAIEELEAFLRLAPQDKDAESIRAILKRLRERAAGRP